MDVRINNIRERINGLNSRPRLSNLNINEVNLYTDHDKFIINNAKHMIENWQSFSEDTNIAYGKALDVFVEMCLNCNDCEIQNAFLLLKEAQNKVKNGEELQRSIKFRTSRFKSRISTKINNTIGDISQANNIAVDKVKSAVANHPTVSSNAPTSGGGGSSSGGGSSNDDENTVANECFAKLSDNADIICECDRIIRNYNNISKRFNMDKLLNESSGVDLYDIIIEMTSYIDTYNTSFKSKYNTALENTYYVLAKNYVNPPLKDIVEAVTDYFIFESGLDDEDIDNIADIKDNSPIFNESSFDAINYLFNPITYVTESKKKNIKNIIHNYTQGRPSEHDDDDIKKMINEFRLQCKDKKPDDMVSALKNLMNKLFTKNPDQIINELPNLFSMVRIFFILGSCAINPILGIITFITDRFIKINLERKQLEKLISKYDKEIEKSNNKMEKVKSDNTRDRLSRYVEALEKDKDKLTEYERNLYTDEENDERDTYDFDDDFDFDDNFDFDNDFEESQLVNIASICVISELVESISESLLDDDVDGIVYNNIFKFNNDTIDAITDFSVTVPVLLEKNKLCEALIQHRDELRESKSTDINTFMRIDCLNENIHKLNTDHTVYNTNTDMKSIICNLKWLDEMASNCNSEYIMEMDFSNSLKLAMNRLRKTATNLSTKEKQISNSIDSSVGMTTKALEDAVHETNREAIIRGRLLPSASKTIKLALACGAVWAIEPAIAVIGALGMFACSAKLKNKERQLVLDDIDIELKMCERYLRQAEEKNDMKAIRQIEKTQRNLLRQKQRIKYKMNIIYGKNIPNVPGVSNYED